MTAGRLLREARARHGLTQKQLAMRAGTTQSAISRIERDRVSPTVENLARLLDLVGEELRLSAEAIEYGHDPTLLAENLSFTPAERLERGVAWANRVRRLQAANAGS